MSSKRAIVFKNSGTRATPSTRSRRTRTNVPVLNGSMKRIDPNPSPLSLSPWNKVTLVLKDSKTKCIKVSDISGCFVKQLDPNSHGLKPSGKDDTGLRIQFRMLSLRLYAPSALSVGLSIEDFNDNFNTKGGRDQLAGVMDIGTSSRPPALHYIYPLAHRQQVIRTDDIWWDVPLFDVTVADNNVWLCYVDIVWMFDGPISFNAHLTSLYDVLSSVDAATTAIQHSQPSVIEKTVGAVTTTAAYVVPLAIDQVVDTLNVLDSKVTELSKLVRSTHISYPSSEMDDS